MPLRVARGGVFAGKHKHGARSRIENITDGIKYNFCFVTLLCVLPVLDSLFAILFCFYRETIKRLDTLDTSRNQLHGHLVVLHGARYSPIDVLHPTLHAPYHLPVRYGLSRYPVFDRFPIASI